MKITREEFKQYVGLYEEAWDNFMKYGDIINEDFLDGLLFPVFNWLDKKLGIDEYKDWWDMTDLVRSHSRGIPVGWETIQIGEDKWEIVNEVCSKDLDLIYDKWFGGNQDVQ